MSPKVSTCRSCGAKIVWIRMQGTGRSMPVNFERIVVKPISHPHHEGERATIVTRDGRTLSGQVVDPSLDKGPGYPPPVGCEVGGRSHFATCSSADKHRKGKS